MSTGLSAKHWKNGRLQDLVFFQRGFDITQSQQTPGPYPVISSSGITSYHNEFKVPSPGVVIGRKGTLGSVHFADSDYWPHDTTLWSKDLRGNNPRFVYYYLHTVNLKRFDVGNSNPTLNRNHIHDLPSLIPPPGVQDRIADILSAYDDLIENNRRRMALSEEAARQLYREWFVRLRFPGHEHTPITNGVPDGWEKCRVEDLAELKGGKQLESDRIAEEGLVPVFGGNGIQGYTDEKTHEGFVIAFGRVGANCGSVHWSYDGAWINNNASGVVPKEHPELFLHHLLNFDFTNLRKGAAQPFIPNGVLTTVEFWRPSRTLAELFCETVRPLRLQQATVARTNRRLRAARDVLLPRLMSGEIAV